MISVLLPTTSFCCILISFLSIFIILSANLQLTEFPGKTRKHVSMPRGNTECFCCVALDKYSFLLVDKN